MTDVRDREPALERAPDATGVADGPFPAPTSRGTLVGRAFSPFRSAKTRDLATIPEVAFAQDPIEEPRGRLRMAVILSLIVVILIPMAAASFYLFVVARDQYVAEARFAVRNSDVPGSDGVKGDVGSVNAASLLSGSSTSLVGEDAGIIASYIHSRAAIDNVSRQLDVRAIFQRPEADFWARLPADATAEELTKYWNRMVSVYVETSSGIIQVSASAFRRQDALDLTKAILESSDKLANSLNVKMQTDVTKLAEDEVRRSEGNVRFALADLTSFRNAQRLIDPIESAKSEGKLLMQLMSDKIETEARLFVIQREQGPNAPGISGVKARLESVNGHINDLQNQMASDKQATKNMAATLARFEELEIKKTFAEKMFEFARQGLERAKENSLRQSIYLAVFVPPSLPQDFSYPERFTDFFLILLASVMTWSSGAVISASVLDHRL